MENTDVLGVHAHLDVSEFISGIAKIIDSLDELGKMGGDMSAKLKGLFSAADEAMKQGNTTAAIEAMSAALDTVRQKVSETLQEVADGKSEMGFEEVSALVTQYRDAATTALSMTRAAYENEAVTVEELQKQLNTLVEKSHEMADVGDVKGFEAIGRQMEQTATAAAQGRENLSQLSDSVKEAEQRAQDAQEAFDELGDASRKVAAAEAKDAISELGEGLGQLAGKAADWISGSDKLSGSMEEFKKSLTLLPAPIKNAVTGIRTMTAAAWKFVATPLGMVLGAIALALKSVFTWFNKSATGQRVYAKLSAYIGSVLESLTDVLVKVGDYLYHAFADATGPMNGFARGLVTTLKSAVKAASELLGGLGDMLRGIGKMFKMDFEGGWDLLKKGLNTALYGVEDTVRTAFNSIKTSIQGTVGLIKMATDGVGKLQRTNLESVAKGVFSTASQAAELAGEQLDNENALLDVKEQQAKISKDIAESEEAIAHLSGEAKAKELERLRGLNEKYFDGEIEVRKKALKIIEQQNKLHSSTLEDLDREQTARTEILRIEAMKAQAMRRNAQMQAQAGRQADAAAKRDAKAVAAQTAADKKRAEAVRLATDHAREIDAKNAVAFATMAETLEERITKARIEAMKEGGAKVLAQREHEHRKQMQALAREAAAAVQANRDAQKEAFDETQKIIKANGGTARSMEESDYDQTALNNIRKWFDTLAELEERRYQREQEERPLKSMDEYIRKYGDFAAKQALIIQDFNKDVEEAAGDPWAVLSAERKRDEALEKLREQFGLVVQDLADLFADASDKSVTSIDRIIKKYEALLSFMQGQNGTIYGKDGKAVKSGGRAVTRQELADLGFTDEQLAKVQSGEISIKDVTDALEKLKKALSDRSPWLSFMGSIDKAVEKFKGGDLSGGIAGMTGAIKDFAPALKQFGSDLSNIFGFNDEGLQSVLGGLDALSSTAGGVAQIMSGDIVGGVMSAVGGFSQLVSVFSGMGDSDKKLAEDIERLTATNETLNKSITMLAEKMEGSSLADALDITREALDNIKQSQKNTAELMQRSAAAYSNGFLGFGGKHSSNTRINNEISASEWARVTKVTGASVASAERFWSLTSEQMYKVARDAPDVYAHIKDLANDGYKDAAQFMDEYTEYWKQIEEAQKRYYEKMTSTSFDSVLGDFTNLLMDMEAGMYGSSKTMEKYLQQAVINGLVNDEYKNRVKTWYEQLGKAMEDGLTEEEAKGLRNTWDEMTKEAMKKRDQINDLFGFGSTDEGSGAFKSASSFTQDQGDELNGRLAAIQIGLQQGIMQRTAIVELLKPVAMDTSQIRAYSRQMANNMDEIKDIQFDSLRRLTEIRDNTNSLPRMEKVLEKVESNTSRL